MSNKQQAHVACFKQLSSMHQSVMYGRHTCKQPKEAILAMCDMARAPGHQVQERAQSA